jgi:hypothetical protein
MMTTCIFKKPLYTGTIVATHEDFKMFFMVPIDQLHPNQLNIDMEVVNRKRKNARLNSTLYVVFQGGDLVLIDGHHTVAAKILNGIKKVKALVYAPAQ